ncbi:MULTISPECIES: hypothetical protein [Streptomyces]|uniref:Uncharacterized protein n=1 Tax=Streptomyces bugieae TaxID=3098223 RepID=A0ABU7NG72_9ACTN|nr:hypothetical protein [Streptomyces nigrescens]MEE4417849.1 hypothetical protein [Streptomyces sp. DSM 41528]
MARVSKVARLEAAGALGPGPVREALLPLPREVLTPQAYVGRNAARRTSAALGPVGLIGSM